MNGAKALLPPNTIMMPIKIKSMITGANQIFFLSLK